MNPIPILPVEQRRQIVHLPATRAVHDRLLGEMPFLAEVEMQPPPIDMAPPDRSCRVVAWNAQRCRRIDAAVRFLQDQNADLILMSEMDWGMARSDQLHTTRVLAERLRCGYAFAIEFLELGLGDAEERRLYAGQDNLVGYHGAAVLFRWHPLEVRVVRLERSAGWFDGTRGERRVGGRIALLARVPVSGVPVVFASLHLESHTDAEDRAAQMRILFDAVDSYGSSEPALVGGDLNTFSVSHADLEDEVMLQRALSQDPNRLSNPVTYEPLFALARRYGYVWDPANQAEAPTQRLSSVASPGSRSMKIDWFLVRGLEVYRPEVLEAVDPLDGSDLSDHEAIAVTIEARGSASLSSYKTAYGKHGNKDDKS
ncbi:MAG: endonuclease/exonuclease/phosphatase family protein [Spirochaetaceae bacterium]|nr:MAG: endonuclease/exonuclease/phosphatase family protein [Spirochaetaceae bacterium]